jgi:CheY-like chemotaxis protein
MDINMSIMDGFQAAECIMTQSQVKPLIYAFTADHDQKVLNRVNESPHFSGHLAELNQDSIDHLRKVALQQKSKGKKRMRRQPAQKLSRI